MGGGLMQMVSTGHQDHYTHANPQITLFKSVYRRHTNFALEGIEIPIETAAPGKRPTVEMLRNGDCAVDSLLRVAMPELAPTNSGFNGKVAWMRRVGHAMIKSVEVSIGGSPIDKHYGYWLDIWYELTHSTGQERAYNKMIGDVPELTTLASSVESGYNLFVPLQFWFCRNYGLALPLIALQYHQVRVNFELEAIANLVVFTVGTGTESSPKFANLAYGSSGLLVHYVYLDAEERRRFAQVGHEYLFEQLQVHESNLQANSASQAQTLNFNHPCKELIWAHRVGAFSGVNDSTFLAYTNKDGDTNWDTELLAAAERLARSMIAGAVADGTSTASAVSTLEINTSASVQVVDVADDSTVVTAEVGDTLFRFTIVTPPSAASDLYIITNPLTFGTTNMASRLGSVSVDLKFDGVALDEVVTVNVNDHTLTLEDVSQPIADGTDYRATGTTGNDVHVVQLNYGLRLDGQGNMVTVGRLVFNGHDRFAQREGNYFNYVIPNRHHTRCPADGINVYSFALHPEQHQPSGSANMSRLDSVKLLYTVADTLSSKRPMTFNIYTGTTVVVCVMNYNVLRLISGMGGVAYNS